MSILARIIAQYALWIYIACAIAIVLYLRAALAARREGSQAIYALERETAAKRVYRASGMVVAILLIVFAVYALAHYVELPEPTASPIELSTPPPEATQTAEPDSTPTPGEAAPSPEPTATRHRQVPEVVIPTPVQEPPTPAPAAGVCPQPNVQIQQPRPNEVINQGIQVLGTANKENFDRYEFKFQSRDFEDEWHWVETFRTPVENGELGWWQTAHLPNGNYRFMLIAIDRTGNSDQCVVPVVIQH